MARLTAHKCCIAAFGAVIASDHDLVDHQMEQKTGNDTHWRKRAVEAIHDRGELPTEGKVFREIELLRAREKRS